MNENDKVNQPSDILKKHVELLLAQALTEMTAGYLRAVNTLTEKFVEDFRNLKIDEFRRPEPML